MPFGTSRLGSSSSDSGGAGGGVAVGCGAAAAATGAREDEASETGLVVGTGLSPMLSPCFFSMAGGMSVVLCLPVVQGWMERNSSKVRTRGLQHFQPGDGFF